MLYYNLPILAALSLPLAALARGPQAPPTPTPAPVPPAAGGGDASVRPVASPASLVRQDALLEGLRALPTERSAKGDEPSREGLRRAESILEQRLRDLGLEVTSERFERVHAATKDSPARRDEWRNLVVDFPGVSSPREVLILGAHFDAVPGCPGADDNATGTMSLLELARAFRLTREAGAANARTIRLVFFNLEESGLVGSTVHLTRWRERQHDLPEDQRETIRFMLSLEMLGYYSSEPGSQQSPFPRVEGRFEPPGVGDFIAIVGLRRDRPILARLDDLMGQAPGQPAARRFRVDFAPLPLPDFMRSDHAPFMLASIPAGMLTDTANFRNPHYHKPTDTIETLDPVRWAATTRAVAHAWWTLANDPADAPHWSPDPAGLPPKPEPAPEALPGSPPAGR